MTTPMPTIRQALDLLEARGLRVREIGLRDDLVSFQTADPGPLGPPHACKIDVHDTRFGVYLYWRLDGVTYRMVDVVLGFGLWPEGKAAGWLWMAALADLEAAQAAYREIDKGAHGRTFGSLDILLTR